MNEIVLRRKKALQNFVKVKDCHLTLYSEQEMLPLIALKARGFVILNFKSVFGYDEKTGAPNQEC